MKDETPTTPTPATHLPAHPLEAQMRDPSILLPHAIELAMSKARDLQDQLETMDPETGAPLGEISQVLVKLTEAGQWCRTLGDIMAHLQSLRNRGPAGGGIVIAKSMPRDLES